MRILVSGFEKFADHDENPTEKLVRAIEAGEIRPTHNDVELKSVLLPVKYADGFAALEKAIKAFQPDVVLSLGLAGGREEIEFERVAINCISSSVADNAGKLVRDERILDQGREAYFSTLPIHALVKALKDNGISSRISNTAGTYVCNELFYRLQEKTKFTNIKSGFIHFPLMTEQVLSKTETRVPPSMKFEDMKRALKLIVDRVSRN